MRLVRVAAWALGLTPLLLLAGRWLGRGLGANPIEALILHFGTWGLTLLVATLAVTPLRRLTGQNALNVARRPLGLFAFFYISLHFLTYVGLDQFFAWEYIVEDIVERPFITVGFVAFVLLIPLAVTSTKGWIRRLGRRWTTLHRLAYVAAALGAVHYYWNVRADEPGPLVYGAVLALLLLWRLPWKRWMAARRERAFILLAGLLALGACTDDPPVRDEAEMLGREPGEAPAVPAPEPAPPLAEFAERLLPIDDLSLASLRATFGEPRRVEREPVANRHIPGQTDTILTVAYPGATFRLYQVTGGHTLPEHAELADPRFVRWRRPTIGTPADSVVAWWGEPLRRERGALVYEDGGPTSTPLLLHARDGRITSIERAFYVD
ncbi:MAG TPA: protein-methionine-sulfoxide reductase heme-binding subunit MsrQ [Longimicrobiales bacterium]|nr:protein-methionine-sulfoxide reductase heme-binding subunit MsrQ [Longimicrobiales bacterium]